MMHSYIIIPLPAVAGTGLVALALGPSIWLTRSERALAIRRISGRKLTVYLVVAAVPWAIVLIGLQLNPHMSISVHGILELIAAIAIALVLFAGLVSLPLAMIVLFFAWLLDRKTVVAR